MAKIRRTAEEKRPPKAIYGLVTRTELMRTPHTQELENVTAVIKSFVPRYRRRAYYDYFTKGEDKRGEIRKELGMRADTIEEWLRCRTRALLTFWLDSEDIVHTEAMEEVLEQAEEIWYGKTEKKRKGATSTAGGN